MNDWEDGYFTAIVDAACNNETWTKLAQERMLENGIRRAIRMRKFSPISGYEPDPKREEWQGREDCYGCPYWFNTSLWRQIHPLVFGGFEWTCSLRPKSAIVGLGDPSFCRFSEYRKTLFRKFEVT